MTNETALREALAENAKMRTIIAKAYQAARDAPELNMSNYDEDDVSSLNAAMIEVYKILALQSPSQPVVAEAAVVHVYETGSAFYPYVAHPQASPPPVQSEKVSGEKDDRPVCSEDGCYRREDCGPFCRNRN